MTADSQIYGLEFQARALSAQVSETEKTKFYIGTQSLKLASNQVHSVQLNEEDDSLKTQVFRHKDGEIWSISSSTKDANLISTCYNTVDESDGNFGMKSTLWKVPEEDDSDLERLCDFDLKSHGTDIKIAAFHPNDGSQIATVVDNKVLIWSIGSGFAELANTISMEAKGHPKFTTGKWNPPVNAQFATANDCSVKGWDIRSSSKHAWVIENAHLQSVRDLDFNPNRHYCLATCGDDGRSRFWDLRNTSQPLITRNDHSHWVWAIRYNHYHDELVASASSDTKVLITRIQSISSSSVIPEEEGSTKDKLADGVIATFDQHEDSVYCVEWSSADPWILASLSYDGRLLINRVPKTEKYKILL
ncbi:EARP-interacting protein homolog [Planococcus citri]|uniref:EARP-interacting protein homolog n=1 Tax=Planococcus citri TaxID=170843 RepID=UPI0031F95A6C